MARKTSKGRKKIEIKKIANKSSQQVTFSKRRGGLFKKAAELCILCGAQVGIVVFSPVHKIFSFGHPHIDTVIHRYLHGGVPPNEGDQPDGGSSGDLPSFSAINQQYEETQNKLEEEKLRKLTIEAQKNNMAVDNCSNNNNVGYWWDEPIDEGIGVDELEQYIEAMEQLMKKIALKVDDLNLMKKSFVQPYVPIGMSIGHGDTTDHDSFPPVDGCNFGPNTCQ